MKYKVFFLGMFLCGCSPSSLEEYRYEGENLAREIAWELARVHSEEDLVAVAPRVKKKFAAMVDLMVAARRHQKKRGEGENPWGGSEEASDFLKEEMMRIYEIEGCREAMQEIQRESLHRLDLFA
jgi:hypothetical protein